MLIRHLAMLSLAACGFASDPTAPEPIAAERQDPIICSPLCDPGYQTELQSAYSYGFGLFANARSTDASCADIGTSVPQWDCIVTFISSENPCGAYVVECLGQGPGRAPKCNWMNPNNCP